MKFNLFSFMLHILFSLVNVKSNIGIQMVMSLYKNFSALAMKSYSP